MEHLEGLYKNYHKYEKRFLKSFLMLENHLYLLLIFIMHMIFILVCNILHFNLVTILYYYYSINL